MVKKKKKNWNLEDHHKITISGIIISLIVIIFLFHTVNNFTKSLNLEEDLNLNEKKEINPINKNIKTLEDGTKYLVHPDKIRSGGVPKGGIGVEIGIPALIQENINFVSVEEADNWIKDNELVLAINYKGEKRVYPLQILVWHEIVNDIIQDDPILITYCPLCGSGIAYERTINHNGEKTETKFGTSGKLYNSNLIMYDEKTDTYWQQIGGDAILGELTGQELNLIDLDTVPWREYKKINKDAKVLSQNTGMNRDYGRDPYGSYYEDSILFFPVENTDNRIHNKDVIFGIEIDGTYSAYREEDIIEKNIIEDNVNEIEILIERNEDGTVSITNKENNEIIPKERDFWFSWYAFHPNTLLYGVDPK